MSHSLESRLAGLHELRGQGGATPDTAKPYLRWLVLLFFGSGCAALIYEVLWFQLLQLVIGSSAISLGVLLGTFMGGMCLGSLLVPRLVDPRHHPLRVYAVLKLAIGAMAVLMLATVPLISEVYWRVGGHITSRMAIACIFLLPPTMAMGATLPVRLRAVSRRRRREYRGLVFSARVILPAG